MVVAAEFVTPEHIATNETTCRWITMYGNRSVILLHPLELKYMHEILSDSSISNKEMIMGLAPYGDHPTFSLSVNHYQTYTGITDKDQMLLTITRNGKYIQY